MKKVIVVGGGFAGMRACKLLSKSNLDLQVTLINNNDFHYDSTALHTVSAGTNKPDQIVMNLRNSVSNKVNFVKDTVVNIDHKKQQVILKNNDPLSYDYLFNALGFESETYGTPGVEQYGLQIWNMASAKYNYSTLINNLKKYQSTKDQNYLSIAVVGGGFTSIELLGELTYQIPKWSQQFHFDPKDMNITCIAPKCIPMFDHKLVQFAMNYLSKHGVNFVSSGMAKKLTADGVYYGGDSRFIPARTIFWTAGVKGSHVIAAAGYDEKRNRVVVKDDMSLSEYPNEYLIGDVSAVMNKDSKRLYPTTGQISIQEATIAVKNLIARLEHKSSVPFSFKSKGTVCSLGPHMGIAQLPVGKKVVKLKGHKVALLKHLVRQYTAFEISGVKAALQS